MNSNRIRYKVGFVILSHNSQKYIIACLNSILSCNSINPHITVIDNGSKDGTPQILHQYEQDNPKLFKNFYLQKNLGTTKSRNLGIRSLLKRKCDYIAILDSDTTINDEAFKSMIGVLNSNPSIGIIGPSMTSSNGERQTNARKFPTMWLKILKAAPHQKAQRRGHLIESYNFSANKSFYDVDYLLSACWLMRSEIFNIVGFFDEKIFYAPEDVDFCRRVWENKKRVVFLPSANIIHEYQRLSKKKLISKINFAHICGLTHYFIKHRHLFNPYKNLHMTSIRNRTSEARGNKNPLITVIVPIYNVEQYARRCLDSILCQTYKNLEIILIDDGSTDNSGKICDDYAKKDRRIKVIHQENGGLSNARNSGIEKIRGKYVTFIDSDDWIESGYIGTLYNDIANNHCDISIVGHFINHDNVVFDESTGEQKKLSIKECLTKILYDNGISAAACGKLYHKSLFNSIRYPNGRVFEDVATTYKLILQSKSVFLNSVPLYHYRKTNHESITSTKFTIKKMDLIWATKQFADDVLKKYPDLQAACAARMMEAHVRTLTETLKGGAEQQTINELLAYIKQNRHAVLSNKNITRRNRLMLLATCFGYRPFKVFRFFYEHITGKRNVFTESRGSHEK